jgi:hypothetical protein
LAFVKPEKKKEGVKFLVYGDSGSGKTPFGLSFPNIAHVDSDSGTTFYDKSNVVITTNTLSLKELYEEVDDVERDDDLFESIDTFTVDSITRFHENQEHAALKVVEQRAISSNRLLEGEGISVKERGIIKLHYEKFFGRMMEIAKQAKNLVFIAEKKDKTEQKKDAISGQSVSVKIGEMPNMQKNAEYDFDVVIKTYIKDGESHGVIEKDRTGTFKVGDEVVRPNYSHWADAISQAQKGTLRKKDEIQTFTDAINKEAEQHSISSGDRAVQLIDEITGVINELDDAKKTVLAEGFTKKFKTIKYKDIKDIAKLTDMLEFAKTV